MNEELIDHLNTLEKKIYSLVVKCSALQSQLDTALDENLKLKEIVKKQKEEANNFQNQEKIYNIVSSLVAGTESTVGVKKKLNEYISHIDKCIEYLNK
jgi:chaperonin cofactor prefoldin